MRELKQSFTTGWIAGDERFIVLNRCCRARKNCNPGFGLYRQRHVGYQQRMGKNNLIMEEQIGRAKTYMDKERQQVAREELSKSPQLAGPVKL